MGLTKYEPKPSVYVRAHRAILDLYHENGSQPLTYSEVIRKLKSTPGIMFSQAVSLDDAINTLETWKLISKTEEIKFIPTENDRNRS